MYVYGKKRVIVAENEVNRKKHNPLLHPHSGTVIRMCRVNSICFLHLGSFVEQFHPYTCLFLLLFSSCFLLLFFFFFFLSFGFVVVLVVCFVRKRKEKEKSETSMTAIVLKQDTNT